MSWGWFSHTQCIAMYSVHCTGLSNRTNEWWKVGFKSVVLCTYPQYESLWASSEMYVKEQLGMGGWNIMSIAATKGEMTKQKKFHTESCSILIFFTKLTRIPAGEFGSPEYSWWKLSRIPGGENSAEYQLVKIHQNSSWWRRHFSQWIKKPCVPHIVGQWKNGENWVPRLLLFL